LLFAVDAERVTIDLIPQPLTLALLRHKQKSDGPQGNHEHLNLSALIRYFGVEAHRVTYFKSS
jgi:hypothetical protein